MCDTIVAVPAATADGAMRFGKNSDRTRNEAQAVEQFPRVTYPPGAELTCTYLTIPQVRRTNAVLLCRPYWIWGAEMGANEHGVVIGNEALPARGPVPEQPALIGMDLVRLALERAATATEAVEVMTTLLERYGQGGNCARPGHSYYHNGFIVADAKQAFVLETVGKEWLTERITSVRALSNTYSIGRNADSTSSGLHALVRDSGWSVDPDPEFCCAIVDSSREHISNGCERSQRATHLLKRREGRLQAAHMMSIMRDHGHDDSGSLEWTPWLAPQRTLCMHAWDERRYGQSVGSLVSEVSSDAAVHWVTATSATCISIYKPVLLDVRLPDRGPALTDRFDPRTLWWRHELLHRSVVLENFPRFLREIHAERDALEAEFRSRIRAVLDGGDAKDRENVVSRCWSEAGDLVQRWQKRSSREPDRVQNPNQESWEAMNRQASLEL